MSLGNHDPDFDQYRRQRIRGQAKLGPGSAGAEYASSALRELENFEQKEARDRQLTREVHEFFATATRQAATIVERMAHDAEKQADVRVQTEMESFLMDAFARMNSLVMAIMQKKRGVAETHLEPNVTNIVGQSLDEFRWMGTAGLLDKHIGQDPFETDLEDVRREFATQVPPAGEAPSAPSPAPIEEHLVASLVDDDEAPVEEPEVAEAPAAPAPAPRRAGTAAAPSATAAAATATANDRPALPTAVEELDRFKEALKSLVRQGTMSREEARAAWATRLQALGLQRTQS